jgi:pSer/pThr/pTyr-binding forkhead associated (FHA) protein
MSVGRSVKDVRGCTIPGVESVTQQMVALDRRAAWPFARYPGVMGKDAECCEACRLFEHEAPVPAAAPAPPMQAGHERVKIVVSEKGGSGREHVPAGPEVTVGRVQGNDIVLPKGNVSKRTCRFVFKDGKVIVVDLKSSCGTYVNGRKITAPTVLPDGAMVYVGDFALRVVPA